MPVSYDSSSLLKCTVSMSYIRYALVQGSASESSAESNFNLTPQQLANINTQAFNPNTDLSSITGNITPGGVPFDSAGASQTSTFTPF